MYFQNPQNLTALQAWRTSDTVRANLWASLVQQRGSWNIPGQANLTWLTGNAYTQSQVPLAVAMYQFFYQAGRRDLWAPIQAALMRSGVFPVNPDGSPDAYTIANARPGDFRSLFTRVKMRRPVVFHPAVGPMVVQPPAPRYLPPPTPTFTTPTFTVPPPPQPVYYPQGNGQNRWHRGSAQGALGQAKGLSNRALLNQRATNLAFAAMRNNTGAIQMIRSVQRMANQGNPIAQALYSQIRTILANGG